MRFFVVIALLLCPAAWAQQKTIFLITDAEGVGGVCRQDQTEPKDQEMRQLLTGEINAAVEGFLAGGADEVVVWDGHDGSQTLSTLTIHPKARLVMGALGASMMMERHWSAVAYVGQHSRADVRGGIMAHSYSSLGIQNMLLNGKPVGEIDVIAAMAGQFGTPVIMLSGDRAAASELHEIVPDAELAVVKRESDATRASASRPRPRETPFGKRRGAAWRRSARSSRIPFPLRSLCRSSIRRAIRSRSTPKRGRARKCWTTGPSVSAGKTFWKPGGCTGRGRVARERSSGRSAAEGARR